MYIKHWTCEQYILIIFETVHVVVDNSTIDVKNGSILNIWTFLYYEEQYTSIIQYYNFIIIVIQSYTMHTWKIELVTLHLLIKKNSYSKCVVNRIFDDKINHNCFGSALLSRHSISMRSINILISLSWERPYPAKLVLEQLCWWRPIFSFSLFSVSHLNGRIWQYLTARQRTTVRGESIGNEKGISWLNAFAIASEMIIIALKPTSKERKWYEGFDCLKSAFRFPISAY